MAQYREIEKSDGGEGQSVWEWNLSPVAECFHLESVLQCWYGCTEMAGRVLGQGVAESDCN